jgi:hypothetical protein
VTPSGALQPSERLCRDHEQARVSLFRAFGDNIHGNMRDYMNIVKISDGKYINVDRITYVETNRKGQVMVHFAVAGGDWVDASCKLKLEKDEAAQFMQWLDGHTQGTQQ